MIRKKFILPVSFDDAHHRYGKATQIVLADTPFTFLVWNVNKSNPKAVLDALKILHDRPHFTFFQEMALFKKETELLSTWKNYEWIMSKNLYLPKKELFSGVKTGTVFKIDQSNIWHSINREPFSQTHKSGVSTSHGIEGTKRMLLNINVHFLNFAPIKLFIQELQSIHKAIENHQGPVILSGDFNTWSAKRNASLKLFAKTLDLEEVHFENGNKHKLIRKQLSFVFTKGIEILDAEVLTKFTLSDHYPMLIKAKIK